MEVENVRVGKQYGKLDGNGAGMKINVVAETGRPQSRRRAPPWPKKIVCQLPPLKILWIGRRSTARYFLISKQNKNWAAI